MALSKVEWQIDELLVFRTTLPKHGLLSKTRSLVARSPLLLGVCYSSPFVLSTRSEWLFCLYWMSRMHLLTCFLHAEEAAWLAAKVPLPPHSDSVSLLVPLANSSREDGEEHQTFLSLPNGTIKVKMAAELLVLRYAGTTFRKQRNSKLVQCTVFVSFTTYMTSSAVPLLKFSYSVECTCRSAPILSISTMSTIHFWKNKSSHMWSFPCDQSINILFKC
jgi:hypothetical protein